MQMNRLSGADVELESIAKPMGVKQAHIVRCAICALVCADAGRQRPDEGVTGTAPVGRTA